MERLLGVETEYAFTAFNPKGAPVCRGTTLSRLMRLAQQKLPHLLGKKSKGMFLANGSRFYVDVGHHPELGTPECSTPWELVRYVLAGHQIFASLAAQLVDRYKEIAKAHFFTCNVDYGPACTTWGYHESYLHKVVPAQLPPQLIPFLVSRLVFTGAGGFDNHFPGLRFLVSPRVAHLSGTVTPNSTHHRGIFHTKNEPLCKGYNRLHLLCGESLCSHRANWLRCGSTALVLALVEGGVHPGEPMALESPLTAMKTLTGDLTGEERVPLVNGERVTALEIQRHYLTCVETHGDAPFMPTWSQEVCREWRALLDQLESSPAQLDRVLDWRIKRTLFHRHAERQGFPRQRVGRWNRFLDNELRNPMLAGPNLLNLIRTRQWNELLRLLNPALKQHQLDWQELEAFLLLREQLFEIDMRFGQLGGDGVFDNLARAGVLQHQVRGVDRIDEAVENPPQTTRARLRGQHVRRLSGRKAWGRCEWTHVWDLKRKQVLDLSDPFAHQEQWKELKEE